MLAASNTSSQKVEINRTYIDEITLKFQINQTDIRSLKNQIFSILSELLLDKIAITDKETSTFIAIRVPHPGLIIETDNRNSPHIKLRFTGFFFSNGASEEEIIISFKNIVKKFAKKLNSFPVLSGIDIAVDTANYKVSDFAPENLEHAFRAKIIPYYNSKTRELETIYYKNFDFTCCIYNKLKENKQSKNEIKKEYYRRYFAGCEQITRVEIRLNSRIARIYSQAILEMQSIQEMSMIILKEFMNKRRLYKADPNKRKIKNRARDLKLVELWEEIINTKTKEIVKNKSIKLGFNKYDFKTVERSIVSQNLRNENKFTKEALIDWIEKNFERIESKSIEAEKSIEEYQKEVIRLKQTLQSL